jgi:hypothetical protein
MHARTVEAAAEVALTVLIMIRMVIVGFLRPPGRVLSWPMYSRSSCAVVEVTVDAGHGCEPVNVYEIQPLRSTALSTADIQNMTEFLGRDGAQVDVRGYVLWEAGRSELLWRDGRVDV